MSNHIVAKLEVWALASLRAIQTMDRCSQQPGIFSRQRFCMDLFINLLLCIRWVSRNLETKLKKSLPSTLKRTIERKSESLFSEGLLTVGMYISWAPRQWLGISHLFEHAWITLKRNLKKKNWLFWNTFCESCKVYDLDQLQRHFYVRIRSPKSHHKRKNFY